MTDPHWLITSGAYVGQEMVAEFGRMPPAFLPIGTKRLYEYQLDWIGAERPVFLTLPESFNVPADDLVRLEQLGVTVLFVPEGLSLGESVVFALNISGSTDQPVRILHGDTLIGDRHEPDLDCIGVMTSSEDYSWAEIKLDGDLITGLQTVPAGSPAQRTRAVACGYFAFADTKALVRGITRARGNFIAGIADYAKTRDIRALVMTSWYDFGHVQTYFRSRRIVTSARHFNSVTIDGRTARKMSEDPAKIRAEAAWFSAVPPQLRIYTARLIDAGNDAGNQAYYETEYAYLPALSELFVFGALGPSVWSTILRSCEEFLSTCAAAVIPERSDPLLLELATAKTISRLRIFAEQSGFNVNKALRYGAITTPSLLQIAQNAAGQIDFNSGRVAHVMHGDFCFSNILYDSRVQRIRVIDPRGYVSSDRPTTMGDLRYDLAKLSHSIVGRYDQIIAGRYRMSSSDDRDFEIEFEQAPHHRWLEDALSKCSVDGISAGSPQIHALSVCLFLSMLPLHSDRPDRQRAFIANALRLFTRHQVEAEAA
jgi:hypothetical protein